MTFNCESTVMCALPKAIELNEEKWEYDAPQFFDFNRVGSVNDEALDDSSDYFSIDHESTAYNTANTMSTIDCLGQPDVVSCGIEVSNEQNVVLPNMVANDVESSENLCLAGVSAVESQPASTAVMPCNAAVESKPKLQDSISVAELSEAQDTVDSPTPQRCKLDDRNKTPASNQKQVGDRGRSRRVDVVTSAKKRLSMSVDRGRDKLACMAAALACTGMSLQERLIVPGSPCGIEKINSLSCLAHGELDCNAELVQRSNIDLSKLHVRSETQLVTDESVGMMNDDNLVTRLTRSNAEAVEQEKHNRAAVVPHVGIPFKPLVGAQKRYTVVKPFSFEERNRKLIKHKEERVHKILEAEKKLREFHAQPFPDIIYSSTMPQKSSKPLTIPVAPRFASTTKQKQVVTESKQTSFKAKPASVIRKEPFVPAKSNKPATGHVGFELSTERRAAQRADWDKWKEEKEKKEMEKRLERDRRLQKEMEAETRRLRQLTVHKAQPVPHFIKSRHGPQSSGNKENTSSSRQNVKQ